MGRNGWIMVNRQLMDHWIWIGERFSRGQAWVDLIMMASFRDSKMQLDGKLETLPRGTIVTSQVRLAQRWGWSRTSVKQFLNLLMDDEMISYRSTERYTFLTIHNYCTYQNQGDSAGQSPTGTKDFRNQQTAEMAAEMTADDTAENTHYKNVKNVKKEKKEDSTQRVLDLYAEIFQAPSGPIRRDRLGAAVRQYGEDALRTAFLRVRDSDFLMGGNDRGWKADLEWLLRPGNLDKVLQGRYDNHQAKPDALEAFYRMAREFGNE